MVEALSKDELKVLCDVCLALGQENFERNVEVLKAAEFRKKPIFMPFDSVATSIGRRVYLPESFFRSSLVKRSAMLIHQSFILDFNERLGKFKAFLEYAKPETRLGIEKGAYAEEIRFWMAIGKIHEPSQSFIDVATEYGRNSIVCGIVRELATSYQLRVSEYELWKWIAQVLRSHIPFKRRARPQTFERGIVQ